MRKQKTTKIIHDYIHNNNLKIPRPIFGISKYDENNSRLLGDGDSLYKFTKTKRREEAFETLGFNPEEETQKLLTLAQKIRRKKKRYIRKLTLQFPLILI